MSNSFRLENPQVGQALPVQYDVYYKNPTTRGQWYRWHQIPTTDMTLVDGFIRNFGIIDGVRRDAADNTEFMVVEVQRKVHSVRSFRTKSGGLGSSLGELLTRKVPA